MVLIVGSAWGLLTSLFYKQTNSAEPVSNSPFNRFSYEDLRDEFNLKIDDSKEFACWIEHLQESSKERLPEVIELLEHCILYADSDEEYFKTLGAIKKSALVSSCISSLTKNLQYLSSSSGGIDSSRTKALLELLTGEEAITTKKSCLLSLSKSLEEISNKTTDKSLRNIAQDLYRKLEGQEITLEYREYINGATRNRLKKSGSCIGEVAVYIRLHHSFLDPEIVLQQAYNKLLSPDIKDKYEAALVLKQFPTFIKESLYVKKDEVDKALKSLLLSEDIGKKGSLGLIEDLGTDYTVFKEVIDKIISNDLQYDTRIEGLRIKVKFQEPDEKLTTELTEIAKNNSSYAAREEAKNLLKDIGVSLLESKEGVIERKTPLYAFQREIGVHGQNSHLIAELRAYLDAENLCSLGTPVSSDKPIDDNEIKSLIAEYVKLKPSFFKGSVSESLKNSQRIEIINKLKALGKSSPKAVSALVKIVNSSYYSSDQSIAMKALGELKARTPEAISAILKKINIRVDLSLEGNIREVAATTLGELGIKTSEIVQSLLLLSQSRFQNYDTRISALKALGKLKANTPEVIAGIKNITNRYREDDYIKMTGIEVLQELNNSTSEVIAHLIKLIKFHSSNIDFNTNDYRNHIEISKCLIKTLGKLGGKSSEAKSVLIELLLNVDNRYLFSIKPTAAKALLDLRDDSTEAKSILLNYIHSSHRGDNNLEVAAGLLKMGVNPPEVCSILLNLPINFHNRLEWAKVIRGAVSYFPENAQKALRNQLINILNTDFPGITLESLVQAVVEAKILSIESLSICQPENPETISILHSKLNGEPTKVKHAAALTLKKIFTKNVLNNIESPMPLKNIQSFIIGLGEDSSVEEEYLNKLQPEDRKVFIDSLQNHIDSKTSTDEERGKIVRFLTNYALRYGVLQSTSSANFSITVPYASKYVDLSKVPVDILIDSFIT